MAVVARITMRKSKLLRQHTGDTKTRSMLAHPWRQLRGSQSQRLSSTSSTMQSTSTSTTTNHTEADEDKPKGLLSFLHKDNLTADPGFNRWKIVPAAVATHVCLGSVYGWSLLNNKLTKELGVVASSGDDWSLSTIVPVFSAVVVMHGVSAALLGKWQERVGARHTAFLGSLAFGGGFLVGGLGVMTHSIPLVYLGYGFMAGTGIGLSYTPPVATLLRWFPDRRGFATGLTLMGFGGGALVTSPIMLKLMDMFSKAPEYVGPADKVKMVVEDGRRFVENSSGQLQEVVVANADQLALANFTDLAEGVYLVGTGSTGVGPTLAVLGLGYLATTMAAAMAYRLPAPGYMETPVTKNDKSADVTPLKQRKQVRSAGDPMITDKSVHIDQVMKTPQFWQIWFCFGTLATTGMGMLSVANNMLTEVFSPALVNVSLASSFVMALSAANLGGRVLWSSVSDIIGRKPTFMLFTGASVPLYISLPFLVNQAAETQTIAPVVAFYGISMLVTSLMGGAYSTTPAYEADMFGTKFVTATHGRMLTASSAGGFLGPTAVTMMRDRAEGQALESLAQQVDPTLFANTFGAPLSSLPQLAESKTVTLQTLLAICPSGTSDPSLYLYNDAMYASAGILSMAVLANLAMRPVNSKFHMKDA
eukprot:TRINITY_DN11359_c0_g1_i1.p1 TRINITY_DN11359_c0_g1~~TRINITY_DN11359_c0_g1_i1.p1  ORF type:complete len:647 (+),score=109.89 TRINITY_DN11359_c0_g1_i1:239-2179(+)